MKKNIFFVSVFLLLQFSVCGQFWMHNLPSGPEGEAYSDTLLNKKETIAKEHIKKIAVYKNARQGNEKAELLRAIYFNERGDIKYKEFWTPKIIGRDPAVYVLDTFYYNSSGYRDSIVSINKPLNTQPKVVSVSKTINDTIIKHLNYYAFRPDVNADSLKQFSSALYSQNESVDRLILKASYDTFIYLAYFNRKGQMVTSNMINGKEDTTGQCFYKYHEDGLLDTINYSNTHYKDVFVRREVNGQKLVILNFVSGNLSWFYNKFGQCVNLTYYPNPTEQSKYFNTSFKYNSNGTVAIIKVKDSRSNKKTIKYFYSYSK